MAAYSFPTGVEDGFQVELENGVTYAFNQEMQRWDVVKGTGNSVWITDELPDPNYTSNGDLWFDNTEDTMQLFLYHEESDAWLPVAPPTTLEGRVDAGEATQQAIIAQIQESLEEQASLSKRVDELSITKGSVSRYIVKGTEINVATRNGELYVNSPNAAEVEYISFAPFDSNGQATKPCNKDDIVEFVEAAGGKYAGDITRYRVVSGDSNALTVEYLSGDNDFEVGEAEEVYVYPQNSDLASVDYVDAQDEALKEQIDLKMSRTGTQRLAPDNFWRLKQVTPEGSDQTYLSISNAEIRLYHVAEPTEGDHATTKKYVDDLVDAIPGVDLSGHATVEYVDAQDEALSARITQNGEALGDKVSKSGNQNLDGSRAWKLKQQKQDGGDSTFVSINDGEMNLYHVATPSSPTHAANMQYVDDQIAAIPAPSEAVAGPASLCWEWRNYDSLFDPGEGKAAWYSSSECYRLNMKTANGADLAKNSIATKDQSFSGNMPHGAIWTYVDGGWQLVKMFDISRIQWNKTDCIFIYPSTTKFGANNFNAGQKYCFTVGGFF